jgi:hypothetical protein
VSSGTTEETSAKGHFHLFTKANRLLKKVYKNGQSIFGETPGKLLIFDLQEHDVLRCGTQSALTALQVQLSKVFLFSYLNSAQEGEGPC